MGFLHGEEKRFKLQTIFLIQRNKLPLIPKLKLMRKGEC